MPLVTSPTPPAKGGPLSEPVLPPLPVAQQTSGEELVIGLASALTDRLKDRQPSALLWSEVVQEKGAGRVGAGQHALPLQMTESFEPLLEAATEVGLKTSVPETGHTRHC